MAYRPTRMLPRLWWHLKTMLDNIVGAMAVAVLKLLRRLDRKRTSDVMGRMARRIGPWLPEHRIGRTNLTAAFPEKSPAEIETILAGVWENLGRVAGEFAHLDRLTIDDPEHPGPADIVYEPISAHRYLEALAYERPTLCFTAHLANWEIPALAATHFGVELYLLYRPPSIRAISDAIVKIRAGCMGTLVPNGLARRPASPMRSSAASMSACSPINMTCAGST